MAPPPQSDGPPFPDQQGGHPGEAAPTPAPPADATKLPGGGLAATPGLDAGNWLERICPYLRSADGTWRAASPHRDHRCGALAVASEVPLPTQDRLCLGAAHTTCERFTSARQARAEALAADRIPLERIGGARFRPAVRSLPVVLEGAAQGGDLPARIGGALRPRRARRSAVLLAVLVTIVLGASLLAVALLPARPGPRSMAAVSPAASPLASLPTPAAGTPPAGASPGEPTPVPTATPGPAGRPTPSLAPPASQPAPSPPGATASAPPSVAPRTSAPSPPPPTPTATVKLVRYVVQPGERLRKIARKFGLRRWELIEINDLGDKPEVEPGQVIFVPAGAVASPSTKP